jgi:hypothetical protein
VPKKDSFSGEGYDVDEMLDFMVARIPGLRGALDEYLANAEQQFGRRKLKKQLITWDIDHNVEFLCQQAEADKLTPTQRTKYSELLSNLRPLIPSLQSAGVRVSHLLQQHLQDISCRDGAADLEEDLDK